MATSEIQFFCNAAPGTANCLTPAAYAALTSLIADGFASGTVHSDVFNTVLRQSSFVASSFAAWMVAQGISVPDDGNGAAMVTRITNALNSFLVANSQVPIGSIISMSGWSGAPPSGYIGLPVAPTTVSRASFPLLDAYYSALGYPYGNGNGTTTFNLPVITAGGALVHDPSSVGTTTHGAVIAHAHTYTFKSVTGGTTAGSDPNSVGNTPTNTSSTGGTDNLAAGLKTIFCVKAY